ncbi:MAG: pilus assembly protein PilM [Clostridia bacterium]|nr:pilus assembly protein PilM [Clostridia bacterium]
MQKKQVAVIDVGSSKITVVVGERGINKTFIIKGTSSYEYDGFENGTFFDTEHLKRILFATAEMINKTAGGTIDTVYVGVPGDFTKVTVKDSQISFAKNKKIQEEDVDALFDSAFVMTSGNYTLINRSAIVYELDDFRRLANPVGSYSRILKGKLSFVQCSNYFIEAVKPALVTAGIKNVECVSSALAQAMYLVDAETRDRTAILADIGYITTTFTIIQGDGLLYQKSFAYGGGYITASLTEKFNLEFDVAERLKRKINLSQISTSASYDLVEADNGEYYNLEELKQTVKNSLDGLCESIADAMEQSGYVIPEYVPLLITGGGISYLRGAKEHVSDRLGTAVGIIAPKVPLMDKPTESTALSLLDLALEQK